MIHIKSINETLQIYKFCYQVHEKPSFRLYIEESATLSDL